MFNARSVFHRGFEGRCFLHLLWFMCFSKAEVVACVYKGCCGSGHVSPVTARCHLPPGGPIF